MKTYTQMFITFIYNKYKQSDIFQLMDNFTNISTFIQWNTIHQ